jgi:hypothetical protein
MEMLAKLQASQNEMKAKFDAYYKEMMAKLEAEMKIEATLTKMDAMRDKTKAAVLEGTRTCGEETEIECDPRLMPSAEEHHRIPNGETAITPVRGLKKRRRVRNLVTERRHKKQEGAGKLLDRRNFPPPAEGGPTVQSSTGQMT